MQVKVIKTKKGETPMQVCDEFSFSEDLEREFLLINVYPNIEYQEVMGFGGAFTEAAAHTLCKLSAKNQEQVLKLYFDSNEGIGYNLGRVHINSCDFSLGNYTYVEEGDETLETFNIQREEQSTIPMIQAARRYGDVRLFASPWSPPAYMKTTGKMNGGGKLKKEYYALWADYYVKFIEAYKAHGISIDMVSVQNEAKATQRWDSCVYTAEEERDFVKNFLGQRLKPLGVGILFWDHNKERVVDRATVMFSDAELEEYVQGIAFHWYSGDHFEALEMFHKLYPNKDLVFLEGCYEYIYGAKDSIKIGECYAHDIIGNFNNYCNAFVDWNLLLNEQGGPNHVENFCDAPIMADTVNDKIEIHSSYYYIGHFSKYVQRGAKRVGSSKFSQKLETVSFKNPDGSITSVVLNATDEDISFAFRLCGKIIDCKAEAHSIATYIFKGV